MLEQPPNQKTIILDLSNVLIFAKDSSYKGKLSDLSKKLSTQPRYDPLDYFILNEDLISFCKRNLNNHVFHAFTGGIMYTLPSIRKQLDLVITRYITESEIGYNKNNPKAFEKLMKLANFSKKEVIFIDDKKTNVRAASMAGINAIHYVSNKKLIEKLEKLLE